jgi:hypothetical protein
MFISKLNCELKTIAAGNQLLSESKPPFALNQVRRAGNLCVMVKLFTSPPFFQIILAAGQSIVKLQMVCN